MQKIENMLLADEQLESINGGFELTPFDNPQGGYTPEQLGHPHMGMSTTFPVGMGSLPQQGQSFSDELPHASAQEGRNPISHHYAC